MKKIISTLLALGMVVSMAACNDTKKDNNAAGSVNYEEYVTLGEYKGIEVSVDRSTLEVTDEDVQNEVDGFLSFYATQNEVTEGVVKEGDSINMDFSGLLDGVAFENGTATDYDYTLGGGFIESLDSQLAGLTIGQEYELPCTFPQDYGKEELNGKDVIFVVTVNCVYEDVIPEYNDEFVQSIAANEGIENVSTVEEFEAFIRDYLTEMALEEFNYYKTYDVLEAVKANAEIKGYPQEEVDELAQEVISSVESEFNMYGKYYGIADLDTYITQVYQYESYDAFVEDVNAYAKEYLGESMIIELIAQKENITVTDEEVTEYGEELAAQYGYESYAAVIEQIGESIADDIRYELLYGKVTDFLNENAVEVQ